MIDIIQIRSVKNYPTTPRDGAWETLSLWTKEPSEKAPDYSGPYPALRVSIVLTSTARSPGTSVNEAYYDHRGLLEKRALRHR